MEENSQEWLDSVRSFGCVGSTIRVASGHYFDFLNPDPKMITIENIAKPLSRICRFGGHIASFYSVAQHCCSATIACRMAGFGREEQLAVLLHDAAEAFCGDVVKPLKLMLGNAYSDVEDRVEKAIGIAFGVDFDKHKYVIKKFDLAMLMLEKKYFFPQDSVKWAGEDDVIDVDFKMTTLWPSYQAEHYYGVELDSLLSERSPS